MKKLFFVIVMTLSFSAFAQDKETTFDRVIRTNTLQCGYATWPPVLMKDPNTGALSGYDYDITNAVGKKLGITINWAHETGWGTAEQDIVSGKIDAMCTDVCMDAGRLKRVWQSAPFFHGPLFVFVRGDDTRFDKSLDALNDPSMKIAVVPNTIIDYGVRARYPKATIVDVNDLGGNIDLLMAVTSGKVDASVNNAYSVEQYNKTNDKDVKMLGEPVRYCHGGFLLPQGDMNLKQMIDAALYELNTSGELKKIYLKYMPDDGIHWRTPALPYEESK